MQAHDVTPVHNYECMNPAKKAGFLSGLSPVRLSVTEVCLVQSAHINLQSKVVWCWRKAGNLKTEKQICWLSVWVHAGKK